MSKRVVYTLDYVKKNLGNTHVDHFRYSHTASGNMNPVSYFYENWGNLKHVSAKGGMTRVEVELNDCAETVYGEATCNKNEVYNKKLGVKIALLRALKAANIAYKKNRTIYLANPSYDKRLACKHSVIAHYNDCYDKYCEYCFPGRWIKVTL